MDNFGAADYAIFVFAITLAFAVRGGAGFGGGVVVVPLLALIAPLQTVVPVTSALNTMAGITHGARDWRKVEWREISRILPFALAGLVFGIWLLARVDPRPLSQGFGVFVMLYAAYMLKSKGVVPGIPRRYLTPVAAVLSSIGGIIGSLFGGAAGPIFVMYLTSLQVPRDRFRATMTMLMLTLGSARIVGFLIADMYTRAVIIMLLAGIPLMLFGGWLGQRIVRRFDQQRFNTLVGIILFASGALLVFR